MSHPRHEDRLIKQLPLADVKLPAASLKEIVMNSSVKIASRTPLAFSAAMLLACVWAVSTALAGEQVRSETVKFSDLNVNTSQGVQALYGRIHAAAWHVCSTTSADPLYQIGTRSCAKNAEAKAIEGLNLPQLTAFYRTQTGNQAQPLSANR
jgi:UrcA family protein